MYTCASIFRLTLLRASSRNSAKHNGNAVVGRSDRAESQCIGAFAVLSVTSARRRFSQRQLLHERGVARSSGCFLQFAGCCCSPDYSNNNNKSGRNASMSRLQRRRCSRRAVVVDELAKGAQHRAADGASA